MQAVGHVDFYPNGGYNQPGCGIPSIPSSNLLSDGSIFSKLSDIVTCSHMRAIYLFSDSLQLGTTCRTVAYKCANDEAFHWVNLLIYIFVFLH